MKIIKFLSAAAILLSGLFLSTSRAYADIAPPPGPIPGTTSDQSTLIIGGGIAVGVVVLVSWLIIRAIRRR